MSHELTVTSNDTYVADITCGAFDTARAGVIYKSLDADQYNNSVSGTGEFLAMTKADFQKSLERLNYLRGEPDEEIIDSKGDETRNIFLGAIGISQDRIEVEPTDMKRDYDQVAEFIQVVINFDSDNFDIHFG